MNQNKFIQFFKKKQVKVVLGILVIVGIMTAMSIGIIAFIRSLKQPPDPPDPPDDDCGDNIGKFDIKLGMCVAKDCDNICQTGDLKGKCLDNLCESISEGSATENCTCTKTCKTNQIPYSNQNHKQSYIEMSLADPDDKYGINGYKIKNSGEYLTCTNICKYAEYGHCSDASETCAVSFDKNSSYIEKGCFEAEKSVFNSRNFTLCGTKQDKINGARIACNDKNQLEGIFKHSCTENNKDISGEFENAKFYCKKIVKKCDGSNEEKFCRYHSDCDQSVCEVNSTLEAKGFLFLKTCSGRENETSGPYCRNINLVGENFFSGPKPSLNDVFFKIEKSDYEGISKNQPCNKRRDNPQCKTDSIKHNWYCGESIPNYTCVSNDEKTVLNSCPEYPPISSFGENKLYEVKCCPRSTYARNQNFCCPVNAKNDSCLNMSGYKIDSSWLESSDIKGVNIPKSCSKDEECRTPNNLKALNTLLDSSQNESEMEYSQFFCMENECRFNAGYIENLDQGRYKSGKYLMADDDNLKTSIAVKKDNNVIYTKPAQISNKYNIPLCKNQSGIDALFGVYNSGSFTPVNKRETTDYQYSTIMNYSTTDKKDVNRASCIKYGIDNNFYHVNSDGSIAELQNIFGSQIESSAKADKIVYNSEGIIISQEENAANQSKYTGTCTFNSLCNDLQSTVLTSEDQQNSQILNWNFSASEYPVNGIYEKKKGIGNSEKAYFAVLPASSSIRRIQPSCAALSHSQCEQKDYDSSPQYQKINKDNLLSPCIWVSGKEASGGDGGCFYRTGQDAPVPHFYLNDNGNGEYCDKGFIYVNNIISCQEG